MAIYLVMTPQGEGEASEKAVFLRDGFSIGAFILGPLWLLWNRAFLAAGLWFALVTTLAFGATALGVRPEATALINFALSIALGFEGVRVVIRSLERRGFRERAVVACDSAQEAEEVFFHNRSVVASSPPYGKEEA